MNILALYKSCSGGVSRPAAILFTNNTPVKVYCGCAVGKSGLCCHVIALLIVLNYYPKLKLQLGKKLKGTVPNFENT